MVEDRDSKWEMKDWPWRMMWTWGVWAGWKAGTAASELFEIFKETWWSLSVGREDWEVSDSRDVLGPTVFSAERGTQSYRKVDLRVKKTIQLKGGWWSDIEKVVQKAECFDKGIIFLCCFCIQRWGGLQNEPFQEMPKNAQNSEQNFEGAGSVGFSQPSVEIWLLCLLVESSEEGYSLILSVQLTHQWTFESHPSQVCILLGLNTVIFKQNLMTAVG